MTRSLQRRLSVMLGGAMLLAGLAAAAASFLLAYSEATEFQDDLLRQIALLAANSDPSQRGAASHPPGAEVILADPESRISVIRLPDDPRPGWLAGDVTAGFHTLDTDTEYLRIFVWKAPAARTTIVAQPTETRDEVAIDSALRTLTPSLLFLPLMAWVIVRVVWRELAPVRRLASHLDAQPAHRPQPLSDRDIPDEILPFVQAINRLLERTGVLMSQQRRFVADAAHELRSPLTALSVQAQNLRQATSLADLRERVTPLQMGIERARKLTEQLLSLAKLQSRTSDTTEVDVAALARELIAEYLPLAEARGIDFGLEETVALRLDAAPDALRLVLRNGLDNALKYTPEGGEVTLRLALDDTSAIIEIVDNGLGIPIIERERVFAPFHRAPETPGEGSGLGLAIAREATATLGGSLRLLDRPQGCGLVFRYRQARFRRA